MQRWASPRSLCRLRLSQTSPSSSFYRNYASTSPATPELYDVVCVGGGPAGLSLVNALRMYLQHCDNYTANKSKDPLKPPPG